MRQNTNAGKRESGFTLQEVLVTFAIIAILSAVAVPGFSRWLPNYRLKSAARDVVSNFQVAKLTAIKKGINCTITFNKTIGSTLYDYVIYEDANNNLECDAGEQVLNKVIFSEHYAGVSFDTSQGGGDGLTFAGNDNIPPLPSTAFRLNGLTRDNTGGSGAGTVFLINTQNKTASINVSAAGSIRIN
jgi:type IV fimbrial biogenesis protein FimT